MERKIFGHERYTQFKQAHFHFRKRIGDNF
jgi:hypothetical protein